MIRSIGAVVAAVALATGPAGCAPDSGTVTSRSEMYVNKQWQTEVCVKSDSESGCTRFAGVVFKGCTKGKSWPDCKG